MSQKYGYLANEHRRAVEVCEICGIIEPSFQWSDVSGEGMCNRCGAPYMLTGEAAGQLRLKPEWKEVARIYWEATHKFMGLGTIVIWRDYPECVEGLRAFYKWLDNHPEISGPLKAKSDAEKKQRQ